MAFTCHDLALPLCVNSLPDISLLIGLPVLELSHGSNYKLRGIVDALPCLACPPLFSVPCPVLAFPTPGFSFHAHAPGPIPLHVPILACRLTPITCVSCSLSVIVHSGVLPVISVPALPVLACPGMLMTWPGVRSLPAPPLPWHIPVLACPFLSRAFAVLLPYHCPCDCCCNVAMACDCCLGLSVHLFRGRHCHGMNLSSSSCLTLTR